MQQNLLQIDMCAGSILCSPVGLADGDDTQLLALLTARQLRRHGHKCLSNLDAGACLCSQLLDDAPALQK